MEKDERKVKEHLKKKLEKESQYRVFLDTSLRSGRLYEHWMSWFKDRNLPLPQPDIDIIVVDEKRCLQGVEVKYIKPKGKSLSHSYYEGIEEALGLTKFGFSCVHLWHCFDKEIPLEKICEYGNNTAGLIKSLKLPINFDCVIVPEDWGKDLEVVILELRQKLPQRISSLLYGKENPLWDSEVGRKFQEFLRAHLGKIPSPDI